MRAYRRRARAHGVLEVRIVPAASGAYTVLEVHAEDRVGLLHTIASVLFACRLNVHLAKIDTQGSSVVDVFYVRDLAGHPIGDGEQLRTVEAALYQTPSG